jgi:hypothetical protein
VISASNTSKRKSGGGGPTFQEKGGRKMHFCNVVRYFIDSSSVPRTRNAVMRRYYETLHRDKFDVEGKP